MNPVPELPGEFSTDSPAFELVGNYSPDGWRQVLETPRVTEIWLGEPHTLFFYDIDRRRYWLFVDKSKGWMFALRYLVQQDSEQMDQLFSVADESSMNEFVILDDLCWYPAGSFVDRSAANAAIVDFLSNPIQPPSSARWTDGDDLDWPEGA